MRPALLLLFVAARGWAADDRVALDVSAMIGGEFHRDALGDEYDRIVARARARPTIYLDAIGRVLAAESDDNFSSLRPQPALEMLADREPKRVRAIATLARDHTVAVLMRVGARPRPRSSSARMEREHELQRLQSLFAYFSELAR